jgi:hypothetical protein
VEGGGQDAEGGGRAVAVGAGAGQGGAAGDREAGRAGRVGRRIVRRLLGGVVGLGPLGHEGQATAVAVGVQQPGEQVGLGAGRLAGAHPDDQQGLEPAGQVLLGQRQPHRHPGRHRLVEVVHPGQFGLDLQAVAGQIDHVAVVAVVRQPQREGQALADRLAGHLETPARPQGGDDPALRQPPRLRGAMPAVRARVDVGEDGLGAAARLAGVLRPGALHDPGRPWRGRLGEQRGPGAALVAVAEGPPPVVAAGGDLGAGEQRLVLVGLDGVGVDPHQQRTGRVRLALDRAAPEPGLQADRQERDRAAGIQRGDPLQRRRRQPGHRLVDPPPQVGLGGPGGPQPARGPLGLGGQRLAAGGGAGPAGRRPPLGPLGRQPGRGDAHRVAGLGPLGAQPRQGAGVGGGRRLGHGRSSGTMSEPWIATRNGRCRVIQARSEALAPVPCQSSGGSPGPWSTWPVSGSAAARLM